jgi:hypothetical protein
VQKLQYKLLKGVLKVPKTSKVMAASTFYHHFQGSSWLFSKVASSFFFPRHSDAPRLDSGGPGDVSAIMTRPGSVRFTVDRSLACPMLQAC